MVGLEALCYIVLLLMPVLGRMSDQQGEVRLMASRCFAILVSYMPLEVTILLLTLCILIAFICLDYNEVIIQYSVIQCWFLQVEIYIHQLF